jgi:hypothetical protein
MAYCEDCGLSSCYVRGGFCDAARRKAAALVRDLRPCVRWVPRDGHRWHFVVDPYPQWASADWIEVIW